MIQVLPAILPVVLAAVCGCTWPGGGEDEHPAPPAIGLWQAGPDPLAAEKGRAYSEAGGGLFITLADFEDRPGGLTGRQQVGYFRLDPPGPGNKLSFGQAGGRTGKGCMAFAIQGGCRLRMIVRADRDIFTGHTLLEMAVESSAFRDDFRICLASAKGQRFSPPMLLVPGWNDVAVDLRKPAAADGDFDLGSVKEIILSFDDPEPFEGRLDDVMLLDNRRQISPCPAGWTVGKQGLDYSIISPDGQFRLDVVRSADGLWRLGENQTLLALAGPAQTQPAFAERLELMGLKRLGRFSLTESNAVRMRFQSRWYFPSAARQWASLAVNYVSWDYTLYRDGRLITTLEVNGSAGRPVGPVSIKPPGRAAWASGQIADRLVQKDLVLPVGRWSFLQAGGAKAEKFLSNFAAPGSLVPLIALPGAFSQGDLDRDGFDESQGCYFLAGIGGVCRAVVKPPKGGLLNPAFRIALGASGGADVNIEGLAIRQQAVLPDGSVVFIVPGLIDRPMLLEACVRLDDAGRQTP
ncbi:MAG: hypothetical protein HZA50_00235 [Planctomycetes bacterium]|nr:hypothetical protein [Planctomycetota bacterium]